MVTAGADYSLVFTKTDKVSSSVVQSNVAQFKKAIAEFMPQEPKMFTSSSVKKNGRVEILDFIEAELAVVKAAAKGK
jgi:GTP-binding protein